MKNEFHKVFKFNDWQLNVSQFQLKLNYTIETIGQVTETLVFPTFNLAEFSDSRKKAIEKACELVHYLCGVSYYKSGLARKIEFNNEKPSKLIAKFVEKTWKYGLAEMAFENDISLKSHIDIPYSNQKQSDSHPLKLRKRSLVPIGGGKDSMVTIEEMKSLGKQFDLFMVGNSELIKSVAKTTGYHLVHVSRKIDEKLIIYNKQGAFNGHVPITSINSAIAIFTMNTESYPKSFNAWDSLAEAYLLNGDKKNAKKHYQQSLKLNPKNTNASNQLKKL